MAGIQAFGDRLRSSARQIVDQIAPASGGPPLLADRGFDTYALLGLMALGNTTGGQNGLPTTFEKALDEIQNERPAGAPITTEDAKKALALLRDGRAREDLRVSLEAVIGTLRRLPEHLFGDLLASPTIPQNLAQALLLDFPSLADARSILQKLQGGDVAGEPRVLSNSLGALLGVATVGSLVSVLRSLIAPENETARLAVLVYARSQGLDIDDEDLDAVHATLDPQNPNAARLLDAGLRRLRERSAGPNEFREIVARMTSG